MLKSITNSTDTGEVMKTIRGLLQSSRKPVTIASLRALYLNATGERIPYYEFGCLDTRDFLSQMPEVVTLIGQTGAPDKDIIVQPVIRNADHQTEITERRHETSGEFAEHSTATIRRRMAKIEPQVEFLPPGLLKNLRDLMMANSGGICKQRFLERYKETYNEELKLADYGFIDLSMLLNYLIEYGEAIIKKVVQNDLVFHPFSAQDRDPTEADLYHKELYPTLAMTYGEKLLERNVSEKFQIGRNVDVQILEVINPNYFWIRLWLENEFDGMMDSLQECYSIPGPLSQEMPWETIKVGQYVAALIPKKVNRQQYWCRGLITGTPPCNGVEVLFIDFGIRSNLLGHKLRFLDRKYSKIPKFAYKASLYRIRPVGYAEWCKVKLNSSTEESLPSKPRWSLEAQDFFRRNALGQPSVAQPMHICDVDKTVSVGLINTNGTEDFVYDKELLKRGLAELGRATEENAVVSYDIMYDLNTRHDSKGEPTVSVI